MGDRANFGFKMDKDNTLYLYAHWGGYGMMGTLANALDTARPRWNDPAYATRICVSQIVGEEWDDELGYGLTLNHLADNEHSVPVVDFDKWTVTLYDSSLSTVKFTMGLDAFVKHFTKPAALLV
jgi:hypothetical protein